MRIVFVGTVDFSYHCLKETINQGGNVVGVITRQASEFHSDHRDLSTLAEKHDIPSAYVDDINSERSYSTIKEFDPDVIFCFGWSQILESSLLSLPEMGVIGVHPANLPKNRGRHPLIWALALGLEQSALTFFRMDQGTDSGPILSQEKFDIEYHDDAQSLYEKIKKLALRQIRDFLPRLNSESINYTKQNQQKGNYWRKRDKRDGKIDWRMSSRAIYNLVRALTHPYVGAHCVYKGQDIKIWEVRELSGYPKNIEPGKILEITEETIVVKTYDGAIEILEHDLPELPEKGEYLKW